MNIEKIGSRGVIFTLEYGDSVYLINTQKRLFLCDTNEGPIPMKFIQQYIEDNKLSHKEMIIFNSHSDWDHIWGNCAFKEATIIGHETCRERMKEVGEHQLEVLSEFHDGTIEIKLPTITFSQRIVFEEEEIELIYAPGHTVDSAICFDKKDSVIYAGDLVEDPIPVLNHHQLSKYIESLELIKSLSAKTIITAHSGIVNEKLIDDNIKYLESILYKKEVVLEDEGSRNMHSYNMKSILILSYDDIVREKLGCRFNFKTYKREFWNILNEKHGSPDNKYWDIRNIDYKDLQKTLEDYIKTL